MLLRSRLSIVALAPGLLAGGVAAAQTPALSAPAAPAAEAPAPVAAPYSVPWQLRPAAVGNVVRSDTAIASYDGKDASGATQGGTTVATMLLASYKVTPQLAPMVRLGWVRNTPPVGNTGSALVNPIVGVTWGQKLGHDLRLAAFLGVTAPIGQGGGDSPDPTTAAATKAGVAARSAMDNAMFQVNYFTVIPAVDLAWVAHGVTLQAEVGLLQLTRVRGEKASPDSSNTNSVFGFHAGAFVLPQLSFGGEVRYQRWLTTPSLMKDTAGNAVEAKRDNLTAALGARGHFKVGKTSWLRPGVAYARAFDKPMKDASYNIVQADLLFAY